MGSSSPAPAPDYKGAAEATAAGNLQAAQAATEANRVNQVTPWGSLTYTKTTTPDTFDQAGYDAAMRQWEQNFQNYRNQGNYDPWLQQQPTREQFTTSGGGETWTQTTTLTPELQAALDAQIAVQQNQSTLAQQMQGRVQETMSNPFVSPDYATYLAGVPSVQTNFAGFNTNGLAGTNTDIASALAQAGNTNTNIASLLSGAGNVPLTNSYLNGVGGISAFNPAWLQGAGSVGASSVSADASGYVGGVPGINYDSRSYTEGVPGVDYNAPTFDESTAQKYADATYAASTRLLQDQWNTQNTNLDSQLRLQGLTPGTEAYNNAMQNALKSQDFTKAQLADTAITTGAGIANQNYASMLAGYSARNAAQAQDFGQRMQNFSADLAAQKQGYDQGMQLANYAQAGQNMNAVNGLNAASLNLQATQANNQSMLAAYNANLAAQGQQYSQANQNYQNQLSAQNQAFGQGLTSFQAENAAQNQAFGQALSGFQAGNDASQQAYNQMLATYGANQSAQQAANAAQAQAYGQMQNNYQTAYQSALNNYTMPLNMMNAVLSGNQVQSPAFSGYYTQGQTQGADYSGAASALGQYNSGIAAQNQANASSTMGTIGSLAMAAAVAY